MRVENKSPFPKLVFSNTDGQGKEFGVISLKAALDIGEVGDCVVAREQEPFNFTDVAFGELNRSSLRYPSDLVSFKPATDLIVNAVAHAPDGMPCRSWDAGLDVEDANGVRLSRALRISGPRFWESHWPKMMDHARRAHWIREAPGWSLSEPEEVCELPVRYEYAFGGTLEVGKTKDGDPRLEAHQFNPLGRGWIDEACTADVERFAAPQIENINDPVMTFGKIFPPAGLGAVPPAWLPRRTFGGTYDQDWIDKVWPRWPTDYDFAYNNSAASGLSVSPYLTTPMKVSLKHLRRNRARFELHVPHIVPVIGVTDTSGDETMILPNLDTLCLDVDDDDLFHCRVLLVWRMVFNRELTDSLVILDPFASDNLLRAGMASCAPHPRDCGTHCAILEVKR